jgi:hypothetical protein
MRSSFLTKGAGRVELPEASVPDGLGRNHLEEESRKLVATTYATGTPAVRRKVPSLQRHGVGQGHETMT